MLESPFRGIKLRVLPGRLRYAPDVRCPICQQPVHTTQIVTVWEGRKMIMVAEVCEHCEGLIGKIFPNGTSNRKLKDTLVKAKYLTELYESLYSNKGKGSNK